MCVYGGVGSDGERTIVLDHLREIQVQRGFYSTFHLGLRRSCFRVTFRLRGSYSRTQL